MQFPEGVSVGGRKVVVAVGSAGLVEVGKSVGNVVTVGVFSIAGSESFPCTLLG